MLLFDAKNGSVIQTMQAIIGVRYLILDWIGILIDILTVRQTKINLFSYFGGHLQPIKPQFRFFTFKASIGYMF